MRLLKIHEKLFREKLFRPLSVAGRRRRREKAMEKVKLWWKSYLMWMNEPGEPFKKESRKHNFGHQWRDFAGAAPMVMNPSGCLRPR